MLNQKIENPQTLVPVLKSEIISHQEIPKTWEELDERIEIFCLNNLTKIEGGHYRKYFAGSFGKYDLEIGCLENSISISMQNNDAKANQNYELYFYRLYINSKFFNLKSAELYFLNSLSADEPNTGEPQMSYLKLRDFFKNYLNLEF